MIHWLRHGTSRLVAGLCLLLLNTAYLAAYAEPTLFYYGNVVLHIVLGTALAIAFAIRIARVRRSLSWPVIALLAVLGAGTLFGLTITVVGAAGTLRWLLPVHIALMLAGGVPLFVYGAMLAARRVNSRDRLVLGAAYTVAVLAMIAAPAVAMRNAAARQTDFRITNPTAVPTTMNEEGAGPGSPFFPSSADTNVHHTIPATFFMTNKACGRCHKDIYEQWESSAHHFSSFNNQWYRKAIEYMQDTIGTRPSKWCAGCHDHAVFFNGRFDRPIKQQIDTPEAQNGLGCTSCHAITHVKSTMGQGNFEIEYPPLDDLASSNNPFLRFAHDQLTYIDPEPHREIFLKPFHTQQPAEFCSACHKVHLDGPVNAYRWSRGFNEYDNWQASGISGEGARSFYYPPAPQRCPDCHMPPVRSNDPAARNGFVRSHRFAAANTALPFVNHDPVQLAAVQKFLQDGQISVDVFGLVRGGEAERAAVPKAGPRQPEISSMFGVGEESMNFGSTQTYLTPVAQVLAPLDKLDVAVHPGDSVRVDVVVRTRKVGHFFPGGTVDAFDVWVELQAVDDQGHTIFHSGAVADGGKGPVDPSAHFYRSLAIDAHGNPINKRNAWSARSVAYVRLIPPGAADTVHYRLVVPKETRGRIHLTAKVNYRKFAWWNTQWAFAGVRDPSRKWDVTKDYDDSKWVFTGDTSHVSGQIKAIPDIPTTVMAEAHASLNVLPTGTPLPEVAPVTTRAVRERWNDYGIGLLLQGDVKNAEATFTKVTQMDPGYADGYVNIARARIREGDMAGAEQVLRQALRIDPKLAKTHFFLGTALKSLGRYDEALTHLREASAQYPRDRVVLNQIGRVLFLQRQFKEAAGEFRKTLAIDPEDLEAHYNLMLCLQGQGDGAGARHEQTLYARFKADEASQAITGPYRQLHPDDNNERQPIHEHGNGENPAYRAEAAVADAGAHRSGHKGLTHTEGAVGQASRAGQSSHSEGAVGQPFRADHKRQGSHR
ncbi:MAG TPA: tetratricopeptide repeat protein [Vicinamibacterales bacterium]|nr:tetratricopeptide repeat protein [Vicinamibacterales bacterium]